MGRIYETYVKRALDVALSGCALAVLSPVMGVTALLVRQKLSAARSFSIRIGRVRTSRSSACTSSAP